MAIINYFGFYRIIPEGFYTFYSYDAGSFITKKAPVSNKRTLDTLKDLWGYLIASTQPDTFDPSFKSSEY